MPTFFTQLSTHGIQSQRIASILSSNVSFVTAISIFTLILILLQISINTSIESLNVYHFRHPDIDVKTIKTLFTIELNIYKYITSDSKWDSDQVWKELVECLPLIIVDLPTALANSLGRIRWFVAQIGVTRNWTHRLRVEWIVRTIFQLNQVLDGLQLLAHIVLKAVWGGVQHFADSGLNVGVNVGLEKLLRALVEKVEDFIRFMIANQ